MIDDALARVGQFALLIGIVAGAFYLLHLRMEHRQHYGIGHFGDDREPKTNCPGCGARIPADSERCEYCGDGIRDDSDELTHPDREAS